MKINGVITTSISKLNNGEGEASAMKLDNKRKATRQRRMQKNFQD